MNRTRTSLLPFVSKGSSLLATCLVVFTATALASAQEDVIYRFKGGSDGYYPTGALLQDSAGNLYGTTAEGGNGKICSQTTPTGCGTVFELTPPAQSGGAWTEAVLYRFQGKNDGYSPNGNLVADKNGNLYGTTAVGGASNYGTLYELERPSSNGTWTHHVLYSFKGNPKGRGDGDGSLPSSVIFDAQGNLYGTTDVGGFCTSYQGLVTCYGTVFKVAPPSQLGGDWTESVLYRFGSSGYSDPHGGVILDGNGNLYGTTYVGGHGGGGVFELSPSGNNWTAKTILDFGSITTFPYFPDGAAPSGALVFGGAGDLYGTTLIGGTANSGTVFMLTPPSSEGAWTETVLYSFASSGDGNSPLANVIFDNAGNLYSTDWMGGAYRQGTVFQLAPNSQDGNWTETILHSFGSGGDGEQPTGGLIFGQDGALYGTASQGGSTKHSSECSLDGYAWTCGIVFRVAP